MERQSRKFLKPRHLYQERFSRRTSFIAFFTSSFFKPDSRANFLLSRSNLLKESSFGSSKGLKSKFEPSVITINFAPVESPKIFRILSGITTCPFEERLVTSALIIRNLQVRCSYLIYYHKGSAATNTFSFRSFAFARPSCVWLVDNGLQRAPHARLRGL